MKSGGSFYGQFMYSNVYHLKCPDSKIHLKVKGHVSGCDLWWAMG